jgi:Flp pilus assembly protein TadB
VQVSDGHRAAARQFWLAVTVTVLAIWLIGGTAAGPWFFCLAVPLALIMLRWRIRYGQRREHDHGSPGPPRRRDS